jgi:hypothetical protein
VPADAPPASAMQIIAVKVARNTITAIIDAQTQSYSTQGTNPLKLDQLIDMAKGAFRCSSCNLDL